MAQPMTCEDGHDIQPTDDPNVDQCLVCGGTFIREEALSEPNQDDPWVDHD